MFVGISNIGKTTLLDVLRREGTGSYTDPDYQKGFTNRKKSERGKVNSYLVERIKISPAGPLDNALGVGLLFCFESFA